MQKICVCHKFLVPLHANLEVTGRIDMQKLMKYRFLALAALMLTALTLYAQAPAKEYQMDVTLLGGTSHYSGDAAKHQFTNVNFAAGLNVRYKFDRRWALSLKGEFKRITVSPYVQYKEPELLRIENQMVDIDVTAEYNFMRYAYDSPNPRYKPFTPYIFLGVGVGLYDKTAYNPYKFGGAAFYIPFGVGFRWKFAPRWGLQVAWQHNLYIADDLEPMAGGWEVEPESFPYDNPGGINGSNIFNMDRTGSFTFGIVFEFAPQTHACRTCKDKRRNLFITDFN